MINRMNKKGLEDSVFTWIVAFFILVFIMVVYAGLVFGIFTGKQLEGSFGVAEIEESKVDFVTNEKFLSFLNTKIVVDNKDKKVVDVIGDSLDLYTNIRNKDGKNLPEIIGFDSMGNNVFLRNKMDENGFTDDSWNAYLHLQDWFKESEGLEKIIEELDKICGSDKVVEGSGIKFNRYLLEIPQGIIVPNGLAGKENSYLLEQQGVFTDEFNFKTNYNGFNFKIGFKMLVQCR